ncbi:SpoIID/LytB domain-containing protein [Kineococcus sp. SYSU DK005]|uniref:SpoIID/LytB domain-containing protein n=1 Tax=Kineococcus sp. SYSU DK005 TaxID=3383126 RepID=UPI003D7EB3F2
MRRRRLLPAALSAGILLTALPVATATTAQAAETFPAPASGSWTITGRGYGHGWGMSQWGAQSRAVAGQGYRQVLEAYYPGTTAATRADRSVRVQLSRFSGPEVFLETRTASPLQVGARTVPQGQRLRVTWDGTALVGTAFAPGWQEVWTERWSAPPVVSGGDGVWVERLDGSGNRYAGTITFPLSGPVTPINVLGLEDYLLGVVPRESPAWFAPEALKAQAVAARSYALSTLRPAGSAYDICDTEACQVYQGSASRTADGTLTDLQPAATTAAVRATAGEIRQFEGAAAFTQFSSSNGGWSATGSKPYLRAAEDPFSAPAGKVPQDTVAGWTAQLPVATVARACPGGGQPLALSVTRRDGNGQWGGRITDLLVRCTTGDAPLSGSAVARFSGALRSSWWTVVPGGTAQIDAAWRALGGDAGVLGLPTSPVWGLPQVEGSYQLFQRGSVYWSPATGAHAVRGAIRDRWGALGWENGWLGFPATGELALRGGAFTAFQGGSVYWSPATGAHAVRGAIRDRWGALGWEDGWLGYPTTDEVALRGGAFTHFRGGSVYWSPATGAHAVRGAIRDAWARQGWETGRLGYPTSSEYDVPGGKRSDFQGGSITWTPAGGAVVTVR